MHKARWSSLANPATWYIGAGLLLLAGSIWVPLLTAERTARIERRADHLARLLLAATRDWPAAIEAADVPVVLARFHALAGSEGAFLNDLEVVDPPLPATLLTLRNKHYAFHLAVSQPDVPSVRPDVLPAYEVMAWPLAAAGPAHSVFFHPENATRAYSRNLAAGYAGLGDERPLPSRSHRQSGAMFDHSDAYRSVGDERWIIY